MRELSEVSTSLLKINMIELIKQRISESASVKLNMLENKSVIELTDLIAQRIIASLKSGGKVIFAGNGGSFSDSFHLAGEFVSRFMFDRAPLPAIALGGNNSIITAVGNDYSYEDIFARELRALGNKGDVFIAISTSGNSPNILKAILTAREIGIDTFGFTGDSESRITALCPSLRVPSKVTARIQESHILIGHIICEIVEKEIFKN